MPNRILKESIRTSKKVNGLTDFQFRVWAYLITYVDDFGRGSAEPDILKGFVFPRRKGVTEANIRDALSEMACMGLIQLYEVDGESYLCFPNWSEHQTVRAAKSKFPDPIDGFKPLQADASDCKQMQANVPVFENRESIIDNRKSRVDNRGSTHDQKRTRFAAPTVDEVKAYAIEKGYAGFDAERFVDYYASKGWLVGRSPMKDWRAAVRGWVSRDNGNAPAARHNPALDYEQRDYTGTKPTPERVYMTFDDEE